MAQLEAATPDITPDLQDSAQVSTPQGDQSTAVATIYESLPIRNSTRLVHILPGERQDALKIILETVQLDDTLPPYEALSYVWSLREGKATITVNGLQKDDVAMNLFEGLQRLRSRTEDRVIWIDALSIDQSNEEEKAQQVKNMHHIYARASKVIVWMGTDELVCDNGYRGAPDAFAVVCALVNRDFKKENEEHGGTEHASYNTDGEMEVVKLEAVPELSEKVWMTVLALFGNKWFARMWVLQEIVLAQRATLVWGSASIDWDIITDAISIIRANATLYGFLTCRTLQNAFFMYHLRNAQINHENEKRPFLHLLDIARSYDVSDPRDKVYGLLGFPTRDAISDAGTFMVPNYTLSITELYFRVALKMLVRDGNLNVLSFVVNSQRITGQSANEESRTLKPSWVPDWNHKNIVYPFIGFLPGHCHQAATSRQMQMVLRLGPRCLQLKGVYVDVIKEVGRVRPYADQWSSQEQLKEYVEWCMRAEFEPALIASTLTAGRDFSEQLITDKEQHLADSLPVLKDLGVDVDGAFSNVTTRLPTLATSIEHQVTSEETHQSGKEKRDRAKRYFELLWRYSCYRVPIVTEQRRIGLAPGAAEAGDVIVLFWGGQVPYIIRREGRWWRFIGEAYVEVLMNKEVEDLLKGGVVEETLFTLK